MQNNTMQLVAELCNGDKNLASRDAITVQALDGWHKQQQALNSSDLINMMDIISRYIELKYCIAEEEDATAFATGDLEMMEGLKEKLLIVLHSDEGSV